MAVMTEGVAVTRPRMPVRLLAAIPPAVWTLIILVVVWEIAVVWFEVPVYILPSPTRIAEEFVKYWPRLLVNAGYTLTEVLIGFFCAIAVGVPLAILVTYSRLAERAVYPLIVATQSIPKVAIAPLLLAWFGYGLAPKVVIVVLLSFFPIVINTVVGLKSASAEMIYLSRSMGASAWQTFWKFRLPQALPNIFAGLKVSVAFAVVGAVIAEWVGASAGLGYLLMRANGNLDTTLLFAVLAALMVIGIVLYYAVEFIERVSIPWHVVVRLQDMARGA